ncbi:MAG: hypothetical protein WCW33_01135 [Candidatus Babeliales bacterium]|jgi:hypothetical protein
MFKKSLFFTAIIATMGLSSLVGMEEKKQPESKEQQAINATIDNQCILCIEDTRNSAQPRFACSNCHKFYHTQCFANWINATPHAPLVQQGLCAHCKQPLEHPVRLDLRSMCHMLRDMGGQLINFIRNKPLLTAGIVAFGALITAGLLPGNAMRTELTFVGLAALAVVGTLFLVVQEERAHQRGLAVPRTVEAESIRGLEAFRDDFEADRQALQLLQQVNPAAFEALLQQQMRARVQHRFP